MNCNKTLLASILLWPLLMALPVHATKSIEACQKQMAEQKSSASMSRCLDDVIVFVDRELQTWINLHSFNLEEKALVNGRNSALKMFKRSQSDFITYRESDCRWQYLAIPPEQGADLAYKECYILLSQSRITALSNIEKITLY